MSCTGTTQPLRSDSPWYTICEPDQSTNIGHDYTVTAIKNYKNGSVTGYLVLQYSSICLKVLKYINVLLITPINTTLPNKIMSSHIQLSTYHDNPSPFKEGGSDMWHQYQVEEPSVRQLRKKRH